MAEAPRIGQVVDHHFLWLHEQAAGQIIGRKSRPCLIIAVEHRKGDPPRVTILPITSQPPGRTAKAIAIPEAVIARIGLDRARPTWIVIEEAGMFDWPGFDLVTQPDGGFVRGVIPRSFFERVRKAVLRARSHSRAVDRD
jgi:hypothetical protein